MSFEEDLAAELSWLLRAGVGARPLGILTREIVVERLSRGPLAEVHVTGTVRACMIGAERAARRQGRPTRELVELVSVAALDAVRGQGGETSRFLREAHRAVSDLLAALSGDSPLR